MPVDPTGPLPCGQPVRKQTASHVLFPSAGVDLASLESQLNVPINLTGLVSSNVAGALDDVANSLQGVVSTGNNVVEQIQRYGVRTLTNLEDNHKGQIDDVSGLLRSPTPLL